LLTTPAFLLLLWPRRRDALARPLALAALLIAATVLLYQNTGFVQFGYRFSLDFTPYLVALLAIGGWPIKRTLVALALVGFLVNAFGAATFKRVGPCYYGNPSAKTMFLTE